MENIGRDLLILTWNMKMKDASTMITELGRKYWCEKMVYSARQNPGMNRNPG